MLRTSISQWHATSLNAALTLVITLLIALNGPTKTTASDGAEHELRNKVLSVVFNPATLEFRVNPTGKPQVSLFGPLLNPGQVADIKKTTQDAQWRLTDRGLQFEVQLLDDGFSVECVADSPGTLNWPSVVSGPAVKGWILPLFEGVYVLLNNEATIIEYDRVLRPDSSGCVW